MIARGPGERVYPSNVDGSNFGGLILIVLAVLLLAAKPDRYFPPVSFSAFGGLVLLTLMVVGGAYMVVTGVLTLLAGVRLYEGGLVVRFGPRRTSVTWDEVIAVTGGIPLRDRGVPIGAGQCRLELKDGRRVTVPDTKSYADLTERIQTAVLARLRPDAEQTLRAGGELEFGPVALRADGIRAAGRVVPWAESVRVAFPEGGGWTTPFAPATLALFAPHEAEPWATVPLGSIPNAHLFLTLARIFAYEAGRELRLIQHYSRDLAFPPLAVEAAVPDPTPAPLTVAPVAIAPEPPRPEPPAVPLSHHAITWRSAVFQSEGSIAAICFVLGGLCLIILVIGGIATLFNGNSRGVDLLYLLIPTAVFALVGSVIAWWQIMQVFVSDEGLTLVRRGRTRPRAWDEVAAVYIEEKLLNGVTRFSSCRVVFTDRQKLRLDMSLSNYDDFLRSVQRAVTILRLPAARRALAAGEELTFGPVRISSTGIGVSKNWLTWEWLERAYLGDGHLAVRSREGKGHKCLLAEIPNYLVLLNLLHDYASARFEGFG